MIYLTGDTHGEFKRRFNTENFPEQRKMTKEDYVIICGDFGGVWEPTGESNEEKYWLNWFDNRNFTLLFVDGNHENHERLAQYPEKEWHGGKVHEIRPNVLHLMRGQVFEIDGKKIFTFGGASSHDISDGILEADDPNLKEKIKKLKKFGKYNYRIHHVNWWAQELASPEEMEEGLANLAKHGNKVDYIITHCCANETQKLISAGADTDSQTDYLQKIKDLTDYKLWFFGHYHNNKKLTGKEILIYEQLIRIS